MPSKKPTNEPIELEIPEGVEEAHDAIEVVRAWIADGNLRIALTADAFDNRMADWGRLLAQLGHHIARAAALRGDMPEHDALRSIHEAFDATMPRNQPTMSGAVRGRTSH